MEVRAAWVKLELGHRVRDFPCRTGNRRQRTWRRRCWEGHRDVALGRRQAQLAAHRRGQRADLGLDLRRPGLACQPPHESDRVLLPKVLGVPIPGTGRGLDGVAKEIGKAGKQLGTLANEVRTTREKAEDIGKALS